MKITFTQQFKFRSLLLIMLYLTINVLIVSGQNMSPQKTIDYINNKIELFTYKSHFLSERLTINNFGVITYRFETEHLFNDVREIWWGELSFNISEMKIYAVKKEIIKREVNFNYVYDTCYSISLKQPEYKIRFKWYTGTDVKNDRNLVSFRFIDQKEANRVRKAFINLQTKFKAQKDPFD